MHTYDYFMCVCVFFSLLTSVSNVVSVVAANFPHIDIPIRECIHIHISICITNCVLISFIAVAVAVFDVLILEGFHTHITHRNSVSEHICSASIVAISCAMAAPPIPPPPSIGERFNFAVLLHQLIQQRNWCCAERGRGIGAREMCIIIADAENHPNQFYLCGFIQTVGLLLMAFCGPCEWMVQLGIIRCCQWVE